MSQMRGIDLHRVQRPLTPTLSRKERGDKRKALPEDTSDRLPRIAQRGGSQDLT